MDGLVETQQTYPPYSGEDCVCAKCLHVGARTIYMQGGQCSHWIGSYEVIGMFVNERLHRECRNCDYAWDEAIVG